MHVSDSSVNIITNLQEAINFLFVELLDKQLRDDFEGKIESFLQANGNLKCEPVQVQSDLVHELYENCLGMLLESSALKEKVSGDKHHYWNIRVALETYILYALRNALLKSLSACVAVEDACLNKIIRNLDGLQLSDLRIRSDLHSRIQGGLTELGRFDSFVTVLGKVECLRRTVKYVSYGKSSVSSDDLLPMLVFLIIKTGLSNWIAQLYFMKHFRLSVTTDYEADEAGFLITSLEAAIEHIRSGVIEVENKCASLDKFSKLRSESECTSISRLFTCIRNGNLPEVERILTCKRSGYEALCHPLCTCTSCERNLMKHQDLNACRRDERDLTPLHVAVLYDQIMIVDFLLDRTDIDINAADTDGLTALHYACMKNRQNILLLLLQENADSRLTDSYGNTALHLAVDRGHESCVKAMLYLSEHMNVPMNANTANDNGDTPLHLAARWGYHMIVRILLECGAKCEPINKKGQTPLAIAYNEDIVEVLKCRAQANNIDGNSVLPLHRTVKQSRRSMHLRQAPETSLEDSGVSKIPKDPTNNHAMRYHAVDRLLTAIVDGDVCLACYYLGLEVYREHPSSDVSSTDPCHHPLCDCDDCSTSGERRLERKGRQRVIAINACNSLGETALHVASATGRTRMVQLLLDAGANVDAITRSQLRTPLHLACLNERVDAAKLLLNCATCDVNAKDRNGETPLHMAVGTGNVKLVALLVRHGADVNVRNLQNESVLQQVMKKLSVVFSDNYASILKLLKQNAVELIDD